MASFSEIAFDGVDALDRNSFSIDALASAGVGSYSLTGTVANTEYHPEVAAGVGTYTLTGTDANTEVITITSAGVGAYILTGAVTTTSELSTSFDNQAFLTNAFDTDAFSLTPSDVTTLTADVGAYVLTGADVGIDLSDVAGVGSTADCSRLVHNGGSRVEGERSTNRLRIRLCLRSDPKDDPSLGRA